MENVDLSPTEQVLTQTGWNLRKVNGQVRVNPVSPLGHLTGLRKSNAWHWAIEFPTTSELARGIGIETVLAGVQGSKNVKEKRKGCFVP